VPRRESPCRKRVRVRVRVRVRARARARARARVKVKVKVKVKVASTRVSMSYEGSTAPMLVSSHMKVTRLRTPMWLERTW